MGFFFSTADPSLFVCHSQHGIVVLLLIYEDDIILTRDNPRLIDWFITHLGKEFAVKDLGYLHYFLGIEVHSSPDGLYLYQAKNACDLLARAQMSNCKPISTPMAINDRKVSSDDTFFLDPTYYRTVVGTLQYLNLIFMPF